MFEILKILLSGYEKEIFNQEQMKILNNRTQSLKIYVENVGRCKNFWYKSCTKLVGYCCADKYHPKSLALNSKYQRKT